MRHIAIALVILSLAGEHVAAQRPDTTGFVHAAAKSPASVRRNAKREAEQRRRRVDFLSARALSPNAAFVGKPKPLWGATMLTSGDEQTIYLLQRRTVSSEPEVHARWDDLVMIRSGDGAIQLGDSLAGSRYRAPGERIGGVLVNLQEIVVHGGDIVRIPAAVPHAFIVSGTVPLTYLVIKQRRQELPIRWFGDPK